MEKTTGNNLKSVDTECTVDRESSVDREGTVHTVLIMVVATFENSTKRAHRRLSTHKAKQKLLDVTFSATYL